MEQHPERQVTAWPVTLALLALLGPWLGAATQVGAQAAMFLCLGAVLIVAPPRQTPGPLIWLLFLGIALLGLAAFLPAGWFAEPAWRTVLVKDFSVELPGTRSAQPWVSLHAFWLLFAGLVLALLVAAQPWDGPSRRRALRWYASGILLLAVTAVGAQILGMRPPFWPEVGNLVTRFGVFPNRNQTANVLALAAIISTALAFESFEWRRNSGWFWVAAVFTLGYAVVQAYSRAGVLLFLGGIAAWVLLSFAFMRSQKAAAISVAGISLALVAFFIFGGQTLDRFLPMMDGEFEDFRLKIYKDALQLAAGEPWLGLGLGNFAPVFALARDVSAAQNRAIHPESDWLWLAAEMGWPAVVLMGAAIVLWVRWCLPFTQGSDRSLRSAAMVAALAFTAHSFLDVSAHRPGSAWPAVFLASLAIHRGNGLHPARWVAPLFRGLGVLIALVGVWWIASLFPGRIATAAPTLGTADVLSRRLDEQNQRAQFSDAVLTANEALRIMPLNAELYYSRALARLGEDFSTHGAAWDFGRARYLEPRWVGLCVSEGREWLTRNQSELALDAWKEALRRAGPRGPEYYGQMLNWARLRTDVRSELARWSRSGPDYFITFLSQSDRLECELLIGALMDAEPKLESFTGKQRRALFAVWDQRGDRALLVEKLRANPEWWKDGWKWLARSHAEQKEFEQAYRIARDFVPVPTIPGFSPAGKMEEMERAFLPRKEDVHAGIQLFAAQRNAGRTDEALATLASVQEIKSAPAYLTFIEAEMLAERADWEKAWAALRRYVEKAAL